MGKYKHGKITTPIDFADFGEAMEKGEFKKPEHKDFLAFLFWFGLRIGEVITLTKESFRLEGAIFYVNAPPEKEGERGDLEIDVDLPYVNLIIERWRKTRKGRRLWTFTDRTGRRIVKRAMGEKYYPHFFRLNRAVHFLDDPTTTIPEMKAWFGWKAAKSMDPYIGFSKRHVEAQRRRLRKETEAIT